MRGTAKKSRAAVVPCVVALALTAAARRANAQTQPAPPEVAVVAPAPADTAEPPPPPAVLRIETTAAGQRYFVRAPGAAGCEVRAAQPCALGPLPPGEVPLTVVTPERTRLEALIVPSGRSRVVIAHAPAVSGVPVGLGLLAAGAALAGGAVAVAVGCLPNGACNAVPEPVSSLVIPLALLALPTLGFGVAMLPWRKPASDTFEVLPEETARRRMREELHLAVGATPLGGAFSLRF